MNLLKYNLALLALVSTMTIMTLAPLEEDNRTVQPEVKQLIKQLDESLSHITQNFPHNITQAEVNRLLTESFYDFYILITTVKPKAHINALILFIQYCELIFQHGSTSKVLSTMDHESKKLVFQAFITAWEMLLTNAVVQLETSLYNVFINIPQPS